MKKITLSILAILVSTPAMAGYQLANNVKQVVCYGDDNVSIVLNTKRTTLTNTVEGESLGPKKITATKSNKSTYASYTSAEGTLTLSNKGDTYRYNSDESASRVSCK